MLSLGFGGDTGLGAYGMWPVRGGAEAMTRPPKAGHRRSRGTVDVGLTSQAGPCPCGPHHDVVTREGLFQKVEDPV